MPTAAEPARASDLKRLPDPQREALREELLAETPRWYSPWLHLLIPSLTGVVVVTLCLLGLHEVRAWEWLILPLNYVLCNAIEWHAHRGLLHTRKPWAAVLYDRHTPVHHMLYVTGRMAIRDWRELRQVLIPAYGVLLITVFAAPVAALFWLFGSANLGLLYLASSVAYVVLYEWMHCSYHLPESHPIGRLPLVALLRRHHEVHHDPALMQRWNMNVTVPLWDWVRRTSVAPDRARETVKRATSTR